MGVDLTTGVYLGKKNCRREVLGPICALPGTGRTGLGTSEGETRAGRQESSQGLHPEVVESLMTAGKTLSFCSRGNRHSGHQGGLT
jgi:hypothetical protein